MVKFGYFEFMNALHHFLDGGKNPLNGLNSHIVVNFLLHESDLGHTFGFFRNVEGVQQLDFLKMVQNKGLIVTEITNGVLAYLKMEPNAGS